MLVALQLVMFLVSATISGIACGDFDLTRSVKEDQDRQIAQNEPAVMDRLDSSPLGKGLNLTPDETTGRFEGKCGEESDV